ncbi:hypothetical protein C7974DRAFT_411436 [Boeremia exigua]|uniref:uncharacterized protein n=1 Tax=Boeremia exigua TaxID=749465 RepID=UPI001E8DE3E7|nr:uncharacterized protein C7974DRAFT_411436 [Boeremia exigua]KAH6637982.1 hypothetical protein C7974DRAFT_411436 [Boeremia exigua]
MSSFEVQPCIEADIPCVFEIVSLALAHDHEYIDAVFPAHATLSSRKIGAERMLQMFHRDPNGHFMKVGGEVPPQPEIDGDYWSSGEEKEFAQALFHAFFAPRQKVIEETNGRLVALEMMMTDPAYQNLGAGQLLVR